MHRRLHFPAALLTVALTVSAVAQQEVPKPPPPGTMGLTGVLSEAEFKALHELKGERAPAPKGRMIALDGGQAYLSLPETGSPPFPAVLVIHEWWGLNEHIKHWSDRLAADGYAALAVDLYGGKVATTPDEAMAAMKAVDDAKALKILQAGHAFLATDDRVKARKRGCVGWCFGGGQALNLALVAPDLDAAVIYYGRLVTDAERLKAIKAPVCGVFGNRDRGIPPESVDAFEAALKKAGATFEIWRFDADHAFANPSGAKYDTKAAGEAWIKVRAFLERRLKGR